MKLLKASIDNFGSYKHLEFNYDNEGLVLIYGPTGSGKSTLQDLSLWLLYGTTSKDGNVDEVIPWHSESPTKGYISVETSDLSIIEIHRQRGKNNQNDLYWIESDQMYRGKDLKDTQKLIENRIKVNKDTYLYSTCYNEFSSTSTFFTDSARQNRELFEKLTILDLPNKISTKTQDQKKILKKIIEEKIRLSDQLSGKYEQLQVSIKTIVNDLSSWNTKQKDVIQELRVKSEYFDKEKETKLQVLTTKKDKFDKDIDLNVSITKDKIKKLTENIDKLGNIKCHACGQQNEKLIKTYNDIEILKTKLLNFTTTSNPYTEQLKTATTLENHYIKSLTNELSRENPFESQLTSFKLKENDTELKLKSISKEIEDLEYKLMSLHQLYELSFRLRGELLKNAINQIQSDTHGYINEYFDGEIRIELKFESDDNLETKIWKNGYECVYKQLSKGQRSLLKLTFSLAVMKMTENNSGISFNTLFLDEPLDGLDNALKVKSFRLFEYLSKAHDTILVIDHSDELKSLFYKQYQVTMNSDISNINEVK